MRIEPKFLFDLDGTLVDSVYQHVVAWQEALHSEDIELAVWRIHRRIGMAGGLLIDQLRRETGEPIEADQAERLHAKKDEAYARLSSRIRPLPGAKALLDRLNEAKVPWAVATSGNADTARKNFDILGLDPETVPLVTRDDVDRGKPDPDLFVAAAEKLGVDLQTSMVVGDSVWDMLAAKRSRALGVGLLCGGYGREEMERAGAYRVFSDPADILNHLDELGVRG